MKNLKEFVENEYENYTVYPPKEDIYKALKLCPYEKTRVVILGQDPYHEEGQAMGLAFSVPEGVPAPPSLQNIFKELDMEYGAKKRSTDLTDWAKQGVLLLNTCLTVRAGQAGSHRGHGWEEFTDSVIKMISQGDRPVVFILWGRDARNKASLIDKSRHLVLEGPHPSPLSAYRGFFGGNYFLKANEFLKKNGYKEIIW
ncbi:MAG: uracil-DNA glycosylase [Clostridia bacterium]|nr:uracil-DNA glycosylase [Clostridia bacterium]